MNSNMSNALRNLNAAHAESGRQYTIEQAGDKFALRMPSGGAYPVTDERAMVERLIRLCHAAQGRLAR